MAFLQKYVYKSHKYCTEKKRPQPIVTHLCNQTFTNNKIQPLQDAKIALQTTIIAA
jgi:hypothetical protein